MTRRGLVAYLQHFLYHGRINIMLAIQNQPQFISRVFTDQSGRQFRMLFLVVVVDGELKGRLISVEPLPVTARPRLAGVGGEVPPHYYLPITCTSKKPSTEYVHSFAEVVSPYFSVDFLINCQPTRAPSHI